LVTDDRIVFNTRYKDNIIEVLYLDYLQMSFCVLAYVITLGETLMLNILTYTTTSCILLTRL